VSDSGVAAKAFSKLRHKTKLSGFTVEHVYTGISGGPAGVRLAHPSGMNVDLLLFRSVPQASLSFTTYPVSDGGEPHAIEHIVLGKGAKGKYLSMLLDMYLSESTAATYPELTVYQFNTISSVKDFYKVFETFLDTLLNPDFLDEEIVGEIYNLSAQKDGASGKFCLEEKGTVYNEMVVAMEKPSSCNWQQLSEILYGKTHPLGRNSGGDPEVMRAMTCRDIRNFHSSHYRIGPGLHLVACMPQDTDPAAFAATLTEIIDRVAPHAAKAAPRAKMPEAAGAPSGKVVLGAYPSGDTNSPQDAFIAWRPFGRMSLRDSTLLSIFMDLLAGGESSYLYADFVDGKKRRAVTGVSSVGGFIDEDPSNVAGIYAGGIPAAQLTQARLEKIRSVLMQRIGWFCRAQDCDLAAISEKARSLISSRRRGMLKFMDTPPHFGDRGGGVGWHKYLEALTLGAGFEISLSGQSVLDEITAAVESGRNVWKEIILRAGLDKLPYVSAVKPSPALLRAQREQKDKRLAAALSGLCPKGRDEQDALSELFKKAEASAAALEKRDCAIKRPSFVKNPPLGLDSGLRVSRRRIAGIKGAVLADAGDTPLTDINLFFDIGSAAADETVFLPLLCMCLTDIGVVRKDGEKLDYARMIERYRSEILSLDCSFSTNAATRREELVLSASASSENEISSALSWLEDCLFRPLLSADNAGRLIDIIRDEIQNLRGTMTNREEYWVRDAASSFIHQDKPVWLSVRSPFTMLFHMERLRWLLDDCSAAERAKISSALETVKKAQTKKEAEAAFSALPKEMAEQFAWHLAHFPPNSWQADLAFLARIVLLDLKTGRQLTIARLKALLEKVLCRANLRVGITGSGKNIETALSGVRGLVSRIKVCRRARASASPAPLVLSRVLTRYPGLKKISFAALVNEDTKSGVFVNSAPGFFYRNCREKDIADFLAVKALGGGGIHGLFMKTWNAGLAYSNGISANPVTGKISYYAERCPDLVKTMAFVAETAKNSVIKEKFMVESALANCFADYRGAQDYPSRGYSAACDAADGITEAGVRKFKTALIKFASAPKAAEKINARVQDVCARVLPGLGGKMAASGGICFAIGPEPLLERFEAYMKETGEGDLLVRLYPRDFWLF